ncbi:Stem 28 kDa glycoprotein [Ananas comosus]|uniref:Stem 28 kDa glycoprotein n=1 Tax=Ananas comosus TaxID=4615 RepID=A0A199W500_ANACO|nr:Stem 28 kDa glycoprotein [Ananas comosus]
MGAVGHVSPHSPVSFLALRSASFSSSVAVVRTADLQKVEPFNPTLSNAWVNEGAAPALPESLNLYKKLLSLGIKIVFLTGRTENQRDVTARNLKRAGYHTWEKLVLKYCIYLFITPSSSPS